MPYFVSCFSNWQGTSASVDFPMVQFACVQYSDCNSVRTYNITAVLYCFVGSEVWVVSYIDGRELTSRSTTINRVDSSEFSRTKKINIILFCTGLQFMSAVDNKRPARHRADPNVKWIKRIETIIHPNVYIRTLQQIEHAGFANSLHSSHTPLMSELYVKNYSSEACVAKCLVADL